MGDIGLIPDNYRQRLDLRRPLRNLCSMRGRIKLYWVRKWSADLLIWRENEQVVRLEQQEKVLQNNKSKAENFVSKNR